MGFFGITIRPCIEIFSIFCTVFVIFCATLKSMDCVQFSRALLAMSTVDFKNERQRSKLAAPSVTKRACKACNREFGLDEYLDHVYENDDCYRAYLASEKKEMSKQ